LASRAASKPFAEFVGRAITDIQAERFERQAFSNNTGLPTSFLRRKPDGMHWLRSVFASTAASVRRQGAKLLPPEIELQVKHAEEAVKPGKSP
jgi:hypothetical protein